MTTCSLCSVPVNPADPNTHRRVIAWEKKSLVGSSRRGGSDVLLREHLDEFACGPCIRRLRSGLTPAQEALL